MKATRTLPWLAPLLIVAACDRAEPPTRPEPANPRHAGPTATAGAPRPKAAPKAPSEPSATEAPPEPIPDAGLGTANASPSESDAGEPRGLVRPPLLGEDGKPLPQTKDQPSTDSPWFKAGMDALFRAIQADDPSLAEPFFFPVEAYELVKDVQKPARDWKYRLIAHFRRDVHDYHKKLGKDPASARYVGIELAEKNLKWMKPGSEGNKLGYHRVTHSRLRYEVDGKPRSLEVTSFISWRGEWYLVHLNGFD